MLQRENWSKKVSILLLKVSQSFKKVNFPRGSVYFYYAVFYNYKTNISNNSFVLCYRLVIVKFNIINFSTFGSFKTCYKVSQPFLNKKNLLLQSKNVKKQFLCLKQQFRMKVKTRNVRFFVLNFLCTVPQFCFFFKYFFVKSNLVFI